MSIISINKVNYVIPLNGSILLFWALITLVSIVTVTILYRYLAGKDVEENNQIYHSNNGLARTVFISASSDNAKSIIRLANEDVSVGLFDLAAEKSLTAIRDILIQLLGFFSINNKDMTIQQMIQTLRSNGSIFSIQNRFVRLETIEAKLYNKQSITVEEALFSIQTASKIMESSREVHVVS